MSLRSLLEDFSKLTNQIDSSDFTNIINSMNSTRDNFKKNILHVLTEDQNVEVLRMLLDKLDKQLINEKSANGQTPLCFGLTAKPTSEDFFLELVSRPECDVNIADKRHLTPLHYSVYHGEYSIVQKILERSANIDATSITGITPLYLAVENNDYEMVCMLLYYNADVDRECEENNPWSRATTSPILHCINRDFQNITELLLDYIADLDEPYSNGNTILYHAIYNESQVTFQLIKKGAGINYICREQHCIMAVKNIPGKLAKQHFFDHLWPMVDVKFMMDSCPSDLYDLCFIYNLLSDDFFMTIFTDYNVADTIDFAELILLYDIDIGMMLRNRTEEQLLSIFWSMLSVSDQISKRVLLDVMDLYGLGQLFWTFVHANVQIIDYGDFSLQHKISTFIFDGYYYCNHEFWEHYFALPTETFLCYHTLLTVQELSGIRLFPSLQELARTVVRNSCRRDDDIHNMRFFAFLNRIRSMKLPKVCEDILLLRRPIYYF